MPRKTWPRPVIQRVLALRQAGLEWAEVAADTQIAEAGVSARQAEQIWQASYGELPHFDLALEVARLDAMQKVAYPLALKGSLDAMDRVMRLTDMRRRLTAEPTENDHALRRAFEQTIEASSDVEASRDAGLIASGLAICDRVDEALASGEGQEVTKALYLLPHLRNTLDSLLATPQARAKAEAEMAAARAKAAQNAAREADKAGERARSTFASLRAVD